MDIDDNPLHDLPMTKLLEAKQEIRDSIDKAGWFEDPATCMQYLEYMVLVKEEIKRRETNAPEPGRDPTQVRARA